MFAKTRFRAAVALALLALVGCSPTETSMSVQTLEYQPGKRVDVFALDDYQLKPVVVLLHGAGLDGRDYERFARRLTEQGSVVFNVDWTVLPAAAGVQDIACAVRFAAQTSSDVSGQQSRITLVTHSSAFAAAGAVATDSNLELETCEHDPAPPPIGLIGISPFSVVGGDVWPRDLLGGNPQLRIRLIEGEDDPLVRPGTSERTVDLLSDAGYTTDLVVVPGGHSDIVLVDVEESIPDEMANETLRAVLQIVHGWDEVPNG